VLRTKTTWHSVWVAFANSKVTHIPHANCYHKLMSVLLERKGFALSQRMTSGYGNTRAWNNKYRWCCRGSVDALVFWAAATWYGCSHRVIFFSTLWCVFFVPCFVAQLSKTAGVSFSFVALGLRAVLPRDRQRAWRSLRKKDPTT